MSIPRNKVLGPNSFTTDFLQVLLMVLELSNMQEGLPDVKSQLDLTLFCIGALSEIRFACNFLKDFPWMQQQYKRVMYIYF